VASLHKRVFISIKERKSLSKSYESIANLYAKSGESSLELSRKYLNYADEEKRKGNTLRKESWLNNSKHSERLSRIMFNESSRLRDKSHSRFTPKERAKASMEILKRGQLNFISNKQDEIFKESNRRIKPERDKVYRDWAHYK
jgi:hypothetical protein